MSNNKSENFNENSKVVLENLHKSFLEDLRHQERQILQYITILAPALGGFIWLLMEFREKKDMLVFVIGTAGVVFFLLVGAVYAIALGYSYRCFLLQLTKFENDSCFNIQRYMVKAWPKNAKDISDSCFLKIPWCMPPEVIKIFWAGFVVAICGITAVSVYICHGQNTNGWWLLLMAGMLVFIFALFATPI